MRNFESLSKQNLFFDKCERLRVIRGLKFKIGEGEGEHMGHPNGNLW